MESPSKELLDKLGVTSEEYFRVKAHQYVAAVKSIRDGDWRPYFEFQWPGLTLDWFQEDMVEHIFSPSMHSVWVKGNTGCGKGAAAGMIAAAFLDVFPYGRVIATASSVQQSLDSVFKETVLWLGRMQRKHPSLKALQKKIEDDDPQFKGHEMLILNPETEQSFAGRHAEHNLFILDEGTEQSEATFDIVETQAKKLLCMGNPRTMSGRFRRAFGYANPDENQTIPGDFGPKRLITVDGKFTMNVRMKCLRKAVGPLGGIIIAPDRQPEAIDVMDTKPPADWRRHAKRLGGKFFAHGEDIPKEYHAVVKPLIPGQNDYGWFMAQMNHPWEFNRRVFGRAKFPLADPEKQLIMSSWLERCIEAHAEKMGDDGEGIPVNAIGIDVGYTQDMPFMSAGSEHGIRETICPQDHKRTTNELATWVYDTAERHYGLKLQDGGTPVAIDIDGPGKGLGDIMAASGVWVIAVQGSSTQGVDTNRYLNLRAQMYGDLGDRLNPNSADGVIPFPLPPDRMMLDEICWPEKEPVGYDGLKFKLTPKKVLRKLHGRSPDRGDSVVYCYHAIKRSTAVGMVCNQLDTASFQPDFSWRDQMAADQHEYQSRINQEEHREEIDPLLERRLNSLKMLLGFDNEGYRQALNDIIHRHPNTPAAQKAKDLMRGIKRPRKKKAAQ